MDTATFKREKANNLHVINMLITLRPALGKDKAGNDKKVEMTMKHTFTPFKPVKVKLFPIPMWLRDPKCDVCGKPANYLTESATPICAKCLNETIKNANRHDQEKDLSIPLNMDTLKRYAFEWSVDGKKWYRVHGSRIEPEYPETFLDSMRQALINKTEMEFEADYDKDSKILTIY